MFHCFSAFAEVCPVRSAGPDGSVNAETCGLIVRLPEWQSQRCHQWFSGRILSCHEFAILPKPLSIEPDESRIPYINI